MVLNYNRVPSVSFLEYDALTCHGEANVHTASFLLLRIILNVAAHGDCRPEGIVAE